MTKEQETQQIHLLLALMNLNQKQQQLISDLNNNIDKLIELCDDNNSGK